MHKKQLKEPVKSFVKLQTVFEHVFQYYSNASCAQIPNAVACEYFEILQTFLQGLMFFFSAHVCADTVKNMIGIMGDGRLPWRSQSLFVAISFTIF